MNAKAIGITVCIDGFNHSYVFIPLESLPGMIDDGYVIINGRPATPSMIIWDNGRESYASIFWSRKNGKMDRWCVTTLPGNVKIIVENNTAVAV